MRNVDLVSVVAGRLAALVHESAQRNPQERSRHERFILTRMIAGAVALGCLPPYLAGAGTPSPAEYLTLLCLVMPIAAAALLSRTGMLGMSHVLSSVGLAGLVAIAAMSGGTPSPAMVWLVAAPLEALACSSRRAATACGVIAGLGLLPTLLQMAGLISTGGLGTPEPVLPLLFITAVAHALGQAVAHLSVEHARPEAPRRVDPQELSFFQAHGDLVTWHDQSGQVLKAGGGATTLCGAPPSALHGRGLFWRVHVADRPAFLKALSDAMTSRQGAVVQFRMHTTGGMYAPARVARIGALSRSQNSNVIWAEMRAHRVERDGDPGTVVAVTRDISAYVRRAEELEVAQLHAQRARGAEGQFLATVGHELRTPLNAIIGFSEVLATGAGVALEEQRRNHYLHVIREAGEHVLQVVDTLADVARVKAGRFDFAPAPFDIAAFAHGCCDLMSLEAKRAGVALTRDIAADLPELVADRRACKQMLLNLLSNAIKFTPPRGRVAVSVRRDRDRIVFSVADNGIGIAEEALTRLGDPFFRAGSAHSRPGSGSGLGLAVVRSLVGLHRGSVTIESALDDGTSVIVALPIDCGAGSLQTGGPVRIQTMARPRPQLRVLKAG